MHVKELIRQILAHYEKGLPFPQNLDAYLEDMALHTLSKSDTLQRAFGFTDYEMEVVYFEGYQFYEKDDFKNALEIFRLLTTLNPFQSKYWQSLGACYQVLRQTEKALHAYAAQALIDYESPLPHFYAAQCYLEMNHLPDAKKAYLLAMARKDHPLFSSIKEDLEIIKKMVLL